MERIALITLVAALQAWPAAATDSLQNGSSAFWLRHCTSTILMNRDSCGIFIGGYIEGFEEGTQYGEVAVRLENPNRKERAKRWHCIPNEATYDQLRLVVVKYLSDNPGELHRDFKSSIHAAMLKTFPCPSDR